MTFPFGAGGPDAEIVMSIGSGDYPAGALVTLTLMGTAIPSFSAQAGAPAGNTVPPPAQSGTLTVQMAGQSLPLTWSYKASDDTPTIATLTVNISAPTTPPTASQTEYMTVTMSPGTLPLLYVGVDCASPVENPQSTFAFPYTNHLSLCSAADTSTCVLQATDTSVSTGAGTVAMPKSGSSSAQTTIPATATLPEFDVTVQYSPTIPSSTLTVGRVVPPTPGLTRVPTTNYVLGWTQSAQSSPSAAQEGVYAQFFVLSVPAPSGVTMTMINNPIYIGQSGNDFVMLNPGRSNLGSFAWSGMQPYTTTAWTRAQLTAGVFVNWYYSATSYQTFLIKQMSASAVYIFPRSQGNYPVSFSIIPWTTINIVTTADMLSPGYVLGQPTYSTPVTGLAPNASNTFAVMVGNEPASVATPGLVSANIQVYGIRVQWTPSGGGAGDICLAVVYPRLDGSIGVQLDYVTGSQYLLWTGGAGAQQMLYSLAQVMYGITIAVLQANGSGGYQQFGCLLIQGQGSTLTITTITENEEPTAGAGIFDAGLGIADYVLT